MGFTKIFLLVIMADMFSSHTAINMDKSKLVKTDTNLVFIKGKAFKMGDNNGENDEKPAHRVKLSDFYIGKYELSNNEFAVFLNEKGNKYETHAYWINLEGKWRTLKCRIYKKDNKYLVEKGYENHPVNFVNWYGANAYCKWKGGRLPTEAEWEYVAATGSDISIDNNTIDQIAWYADNSNNKIHKTGSKKPNKLGIHDLQGSLWEWCSDWYDTGYYAKSKRKNPINTNKADYKVIRGGSWANNKTMMQVTNRNAINPGINKINLGFRIVYDF